MDITEVQQLMNNIIILLTKIEIFLIKRGRAIHACKNNNIIDKLQNSQQYLENIPKTLNISEAILWRSARYFFQVLFCN